MVSIFKHSRSRTTSLITSNPHTPFVISFSCLRGRLWCVPCPRGLPPSYIREGLGMDMPFLPCPALPPRSIMFSQRAGDRPPTASLAPSPLVRPSPPLFYPTNLLFHNLPWVRCPTSKGCYPCVECPMSASCLLCRPSYGAAPFCCHVSRSRCAPCPPLGCPSPPLAGPVALLSALCVRLLVVLLLDLYVSSYVGWRAFWYAVVGSFGIFPEVDT
jgi:hypothetical protein